MPVQGIELRRALPADAGAMFEVHRQAVQELCRTTYSEAELAVWFFGRSPQIYEPALSAGQIYVACRQSKVVGFVGFVAGEVTLLFVSPKVSSQGIGRALFEFGLARASTGHVGPLVVVATLNSQRLYEQYGFREVVREAIGRGEPEVHIEVVRMERSVAGSPNPSIERTPKSQLRCLPVAAHVER